MALQYSKQLLSGSTAGKFVEINNTSSPGTTIHTVVATATAAIEEVYIYVQNSAATDTEADILRHISKEPVHVDEVCRESGLPVSTVSSLLAMMELKGLVKQMAPMAYVRAREVRAPYGG